VELPQQTLYLIDKVVRQKAMQGPIGVDNSEVINLEMERDLKKKQKKHLGAKGQPESDDEDHMNDEERENYQNERLLNRLYKAADLDKEAHVRFAEDAGDHGIIDAQNQALI